jgi:hypothetical protein
VRTGRETGRLLKARYSGRIFSSPLNLIIMPNIGQRKGDSVTQNGIKLMCLHIELLTIQAEKASPVFNPGLLPDEGQIASQTGFFCMR